MTRREARELWRQGMRTVMTHDASLLADLRILASASNAGDGGPDAPVAVDDAVVARIRGAVCV